jgi:hypothetical protein
MARECPPGPQGRPNRPSSTISLVVGRRRRPHRRALDRPGGLLCSLAGQTGRGRRPQLPHPRGTHQGRDQGTPTGTYPGGPRGSRIAVERSGGWLGIALRNGATGRVPGPKLASILARRAWLRCPLPYVNTQPARGVAGTTASHDDHGGGVWIGLRGPDGGVWAASAPPGWFGRARQAAGPDTTSPRIATQQPGQPAGPGRSPVVQCRAVIGWFGRSPLGVAGAARRWKHSLVVARSTRMRLWLLTVR